MQFCAWKCKSKVQVFENDTVHVFVEYKETSLVAYKNVNCGNGDVMAYVLHVLSIGVFTGACFFTLLKKHCYLLA